MSDPDRFTAFLRHAAASYNEPPEVPAEAMWMGVEQGVEDAAATPADTPGRLAQAGAPAGADPVDNAPILAPGYHAPPPAPRDEMWDRIEASWALRRRAWTGRRGTAGWATALAAAASLVLGIALGRATRDPQPGETAVPAAVTAPRATASEAASPSVAVAESQPMEADEPATPAAEALSTEVIAATGSVDVHQGGETAARYRVAVNTPGESPMTRPGRFEPEHDYVTARHLGRAATLLTAFRTDRRTPASQQDLALWARELLVDTRMFLSLSDFGSPIEEALLEDLELVLIQIAGLGPGAPDFEWVLARESMERRGTLARLRAASAEAET